METNIHVSLGAREQRKGRGASSSGKVLKSDHNRLAIAIQQHAARDREDSEFKLCRNECLRTSKIRRRRRSHAVHRDRGTASSSWVFPRRSLPLSTRHSDLTISHSRLLCSQPSRRPLCYSELVVLGIYSSTSFTGTLAPLQNYNLTGQ